MPTYEYRCTSCGHQFEMRQGFDAESRQECPQCGNVAKRLLFPPPIVFKGSGFYVTDSKKGSSVTVPAAEPVDAKKDSSSSNGTTTESTTTTTPAAKSEPAAAASD